MSGAGPRPRTAANPHGPAWLVRTLRALLSLVQRVYTLALAGLVLWLSYLAFAYLVRSLLLPPAPPPQIVQVPTRLGLRQLAESPGALAGTGAVPQVRSPLSHFHRITGWPRPDRANSCTRSGCHAPLPHSQRKTVRAFLNMHATALHCSVCHLPSDQRPLPLIWYDPRNGRPREPPSLLRAYGWLTSPDIRATERFSEQDQRFIVRLLRAAASGIGGEPVLEELARHLAATRADSDQFRRALETTREELPHHFRAEYDAKLALRDAAGRPVLGFGQGQDLVREILAEQQAGRSPSQALVDELHRDLRRPTLHCTQCHRADGSLVDLASLGYPPARVRHLRQELIFRMVEDIAAGQPFYLPAFLAPAASQPATQP